MRRQLLLIAESVCAFYRCAGYMIYSLGMRLTSHFQPTRRVEDDVVYIARMVSDNTEDGDVRDAFFETVIQL